MMYKKSTVILVILVKSALSIPLQGFYPFGAASSGQSTTLANGDNAATSRIFTRAQYNFFNQRKDSVIVSVNGAIGFGAMPPQFTSNPFPLGGSTEEMVAPFWADVDTRGTGNVWYRESNNAGLLARANNEIATAFPAQIPFTAIDLLIATWEGVGYFDSKTDKTNTFQCVLATDNTGTRTYAIFLYADGLIQWTTGENDGGVDGLGGTPAQVGFNRAGNTGMFAAIAASGMDDIINITSTSNINMPGVWIFRISDADIETVYTCVFNGQQYTVGQQIQPDCGTRCRCEPGGMFSCTPVPCSIDGPTCHINGDPHYRTFDSRWHHFQGTCEYTLTKPCASNDFSVSARNAGHNSVVSCIDEVIVSVPSENFIAVLGRGNGGTVTINGNPHPNTGNGMIFQTANQRIEVVRTGGFPYVLLHAIGIRIFWNGLYRVGITVSSQLRDQLCGLCGTYNGNQVDDYTAPDGTVLNDVNVFGNSWLVPSNTPGCTGGNIGKREVSKRNTLGIPGCTNDTAVIQEGRTRCSVLSQRNFAACNAFIDPATFIENCEFDYCCNDEAEREDGYCDSLEAYAGACAVAGVPPPNWRQKFCPIDCPAGMVYQQCGALCPQTCDNIGVVCEGGCAEGCFCPENQVFLDGECVDPFRCTACPYMGMLYEEGTQIQPNCSTRCTCRNRQFECETQECFADGPTCFAAGDPHYQTFDLRYYDFQGDCEYILSTPCDSDEFSIIVGNTAHNEFVSCTEQVTILVPGENLIIVLGRGGGGTVTINGEVQPNNGDEVKALTGGVEVVRTGGHPHVFLTAQGIRVFWDGNYRVEVTVSTAWQGRLCGLCGNYNNNASDDFTTPAGDLATTVDDFGTSWVTGNMTGCGLLSPPPRCFGEIRSQAEMRCTVLSSGVFAACNGMVDPTPFIEDCIFDYCNCNDQDREDCYCNSLAIYASACSAAGAPLLTWRDFFCPLQCPAGMMFQQCGSLCPRVCGGPTNCIGGCAEGCFCPNGQVINDEGQCVPAGNCGGTFGDPHFIVPLPSKEVLCYSIQGYPGLTFNLISNKNFIINAYFVDSMGDKTETTWIGKLAVIPQNGNKSDAVIFDSVNQEVIMVGQGNFRASVVKQIIFNENGKVSVKFTKGLTKQSGNPTVHVVYSKPRADFDVTFHVNHLNVDWNFQIDNLPGIHGLMGQFMTKGMDIDTRKEMLIYPDGHDPVPVTKDTTMTGKPDKPCWKAMNNGIQGEGLIKGNVLNYMVSNILADDYSFKNI